MGEKVAANWVACYEQVGNFQASKVNHVRSRHQTTIKRGGNVVAYLCTPQREVLTFTVGPIPARQMVEAIEFAENAYREIKELHGNARLRRLAQLHKQALPAEARDAFQPTEARALAERLAADDDAGAAAVETEEPAETAEPEHGEDGEGVAIARAGAAELVAKLGRERVEDRVSAESLLKQLLGARSQMFRHAAGNRRAAIGFVRNPRLGTPTHYPHYLMQFLPAPQLETIEKPVFELLANQKFRRPSAERDAFAKRVQENQKQGKFTVLFVGHEFNVSFARWGGRSSAAFQFAQAQRDKAASTRLEAIKKSLQRSTLRRAQDRYEILQIGRVQLTSLMDDLDLPPVEALSRRPVEVLVIDAEGRQRARMPHGISLESLKRKLVAIITPDVKRVRTPQAKEQLAQNRLQLAKSLLTRSPSSARRWLEKTVSQFPKTKAAAEARSLLKSL